MGSSWGRASASLDALIERSVKRLKRAGTGGVIEPCLQNGIVHNRTSHCHRSNVFPLRGESVADYQPACEEIG